MSGLDLDSSSVKTFSQVHLHLNNETMNSSFDKSIENFKREVFYGMHPLTL